MQRRETIAAVEREREREREREIYLNHSGKHSKISKHSRTNKNSKRGRSKIGKNGNILIKMLLIVILLVLAIIALNFGATKFLQNGIASASVTFNSLVIDEADIIPEAAYRQTQAIGEITAANPTSTGLKLYYKTSELGTWTEYEDGFYVQDNGKVYVRYQGEDQDGEEYFGPITEKEIANIAVAGIKETRVIDGEEQEVLVTYKTLKQAIEACEDNAGETATEIEILADINVDTVIAGTQTVLGEIPVNKNIIIDLNGHTIISTAEIPEGMEIYALRNSGKLEIKDSGLPEENSILARPTNNVIEITVTGAVIWQEISEGVAREGMPEAQNSLNLPLEIESTGKLTASLNNTVYNYGNGDFALTSGTIENTNEEGMTVNSVENSVVQINGGSINSEGEGILLCDNSTISMTDGSITAKKFSIRTYGDSTGNISISGGTIITTNNFQAIKHDGDGNVIIDELNGKGTYIRSVNHAIMNSSTGTVLVKKGTLVSTAGTGIYSISTGTVIVGDGETQEAIEDVNVENPKICGYTSGINRYTTSVLYFYDGTIKGQAGAGSAIAIDIKGVPENYTVKKSISTENGRTTETAILGIGTITFNPNGGTMNAATQATTYSQGSGTTITMNNPTRDGYEFMGWLSDKKDNVKDTGYWSYTDSVDPLTGEHLELIDENNHRMNGIAGGYNIANLNDLTAAYGAGKASGKIEKVNYSQQEGLNPLHNSSANSFYRITRMYYTDASYAPGPQKVINYVDKYTNIVYVIVARFPEDWTICLGSNSGIKEYKFLTGSSGTGDWKTYVLSAIPNETGRLMNTGFFYLKNTKSSNTQEVKMDVAYMKAYYTNRQQQTEGTNKFSVGKVDETLTALWRAVNQTVNVNVNNTNGKYKISASNLFDKTEICIDKSKLISRNDYLYGGSTLISTDDTRFISGWIRIIPGASYKITGVTDGGSVDWSTNRWNKNECLSSNSSQITSYTNGQIFTAPATYPIYPDGTPTAVTYGYLRFDAKNTDIDNVRLEMVDSPEYTTTQSLEFPNNATVEVIATPNSGYSVSANKASGLGTFSQSTNGDIVTGTLANIAGNSATTQINIVWEAKQYAITYDYNYLENDLFEGEESVANNYKRNIIGASVEEEINNNAEYGKQFKITMTSNGQNCSGIYVWTKDKTKFVNGKTYTWSVYLKTSSERNIYLGHHSQGNYMVVGTEWKRYTGIFTATNETNALVFYTTDESKWNAGDILYIHSLDLQEADGLNVTTTTQTYGNQIQLPATPTRTGYTFGGWYTDPVGGTRVENTNLVPAEDKTYYARWVKN